jgi:hypothetical protein
VVNWFVIYSAQRLAYKQVNNAFSNLKLWKVTKTSTSYYRHRVKSMSTSCLWLLTTSKKQCNRSVKIVCDKLPRSLTTKRFPFQALTGCDTTSFFANPVNILHGKFPLSTTQCWKKFGICELTQETLKSPEAFVCRQYKVHKTNLVDSQQYVVLQELNQKQHMMLFYTKRVYNQSVVWRNGHFVIMSVLSVPVTSGREYGNSRL